MYMSENMSENKTWIRRGFEVYAIFLQTVDHFRSSNTPSWTTNLGSYNKTELLHMVSLSGLHISACDSPGYHNITAGVQVNETPRLNNGR